MHSKKIGVVGSTNMDMVVKTTRIPEPGETILAGTFFMNPGGKGANQAVAAARLGAEVFFVTKVGNDVFGKQFQQIFNTEGINTSFLLSDPGTPSGVALITVDDQGENSIVVASGANANLLPADLTNVLSQINQNTILLLQLETPMQTIDYLINYAASNGALVVLNPAPMNTLSTDTLSKIDILTPNKKEAKMLSGIDVTDNLSAKTAALKIHGMGVKNVIITMGNLGAVVCEGGATYHVPAPKVHAIDTTAAGDIFNGALVVALSEGKNLRDAVNFACHAAAISVTRLGAQSSAPHRSEVLTREIPSEKRDEYSI